MEKTKCARKYQIWLLKNRKDKKIKITKVRRIKIQGLSAGKVYKLKIRGVNGKKKGKFAVVKVKTKSLTKKPGTPAVSSPGNDSSAAGNNSPAEAKDLNANVETMEEKNDLNITVKEYG